MQPALMLAHHTTCARVPSLLSRCPRLLSSWHSLSFLTHYLSRARMLTPHLKAGADGGTESSATCRHDQGFRGRQVHAWEECAPALRANKKYSRASRRPDSHASGSSTREESAPPPRRRRFSLETGALEATDGRAKAWDVWCRALTGTAHAACKKWQ